MTASSNVLIIMGSVRPNRICPKVSAWVSEIGGAENSADLELVDLADWHLPMDVEPGIPAHDGYVSAETKAWSAKVHSAAAFVFVTPQYNWGYPAVLKNAIDHLYHEWNGKPAVVVSYGGHGGGKCAEQLHQVLTGLKMDVVEPMPGLVLDNAVITTNTGDINAAEAFADHEIQIKEAFIQLAGHL